jgi:chromate transporter
VLENPALHRLLDGVAAAVVGIIAATVVDLAQSTVARASSPLSPMLIFAVALVAAWRLKGRWVTPALVLMGGLAGLLPI